MRALRNSLDRLYFGGANAASWWTIALYAIPALWVNLAFDRENLGGEFGAWVILAVSSYVATVLPLVIARYTILRPERSRSRVGATAVVYLLASMTRISVAIPVGLSLGVITPEYALFRFWSSPFHVVFWLVVISALVSQRQAHTSRMRVLAENERTLGIREQSSREVLAAQEKSMRDEIRVALAPSLEWLERELHSVAPARASEVVTQLTDAVDNVVRPLALNLTQRPDPTAWPTPPAHSQPQWTAVWHERIAMRNVNSPKMITGLTLYAAFLPTVNAYGWMPLLAFIIPGILFATACGYVFNLLAQRVHVRVWVAVTTTVSLYVVTVLVVSLAAQWANQFVEIKFPSDLLVQFAWTTGAIALTVAVYRVAVFGRHRAEEQLRQTNGRLERLTSHLRQQTWLSRNHLATVLHGSVQAAFQAGAIRASQSTEISDDLIHEVHSTITGALNTFSEERLMTREEFTNACNNMTLLWNGIARIHFDVDPKFLDTFVESHTSARCVIEVIREGVSNAVKHSSTRRIDVTVDMFDDVAQVKVVNDGLVDDNVRSGFGQRMLDDVCLTWSLTSSEEKVLSARILVGESSHSDTRTFADLANE